jgi:hypothetical protein
MKLLPDGGLGKWSPCRRGAMTWIRARFGVCCPSAPQERDAIVQVGQSRSLRDHAYQGRRRQLLDVVKGRSSGYNQAAFSWQALGN